MWETAAIVILSLIRLEISSAQECLLDVAVYMPFLVRVQNNQRGNGFGLTLATGSIITPDTVLTTCMALASMDAGRLACNAVQANYTRSGIEDEDHSRNAGVAEDQRGCMELRTVKSKVNHPLCPASRPNAKEYENSWTRFNVAVLVVNQKFLNKSEAVPTLPFLPDVDDELEMINRFNSIRTERAELPVFFNNEPKAWYQRETAARSLPLLTECRPLICNNQPAICNETIANSTGYVLCARRVIQQQSGIAWSDYFMRDVDVRNRDYYDCSKTGYAVGAPVMSRGLLLGIVTQCRDFGFVISTVYSIRLFILPLIENGYTEETLYMDSSDIPLQTDVVSPEPRTYRHFAEKADYSKNSRTLTFYSV